MPGVEQREYVANSIQSAAFRSLGVLFRLQVGLRDRLHDQQGCRLGSAILAHGDA